MKITAAEAIPIKIPLKKPFSIAVGAITHTNHVLVRMMDDDGRIGWGEAITFHAVYGYDQKSLYHVLTDHLIPAVMGLDPRNTVKLHQVMDRAIPYNLMAKAAIDLASIDLAAQSVSVPVHTLIGGKRIDRIPLIGVVDIVSPEEAADAAEAQVAEGCGTIKIKIGMDEIFDIKRVESVRSRVGETVRLRVDGNAGYDRATAVRVFSRLDHFHLEWIEQPLPAHDLVGMAMLADRLDTPLALDESVYTPYDAQHCIDLGAADVVNIKLAKCGGIYRSQKIAAVCEAAGVPCFLGGCIETAPGTAAAAHFYAATSNIVSAAEIFGSPFYVDDLVEEGLHVVDGTLELPDIPGLGVVVDEEKVAKYRMDF